MISSWIGECLMTMAICLKRVQFSGGDGEANLMYYGTSQASYESSHELKSNEDANDWTDLIEFIDFINNSSDIEFETEHNHLDLGPFLSSAALDNIFSNLDSYTQSARNYYIYHQENGNGLNGMQMRHSEAMASLGGRIPRLSI